MILAAAACADGDGPPPPELTLAWRCEQYHVLPYPGGLLDQPAGLVNRMTAALNAFTVWRAYIQAPRKGEWIAANPDGWRIVGEIINGKLYN